MRFSITIPDDLITQIDNQIIETGESRAEWIRNACTTMITTSITELESIIEAHQERSTQMMEQIAELTAERDRLQAVINGDHSGDHEITTLKSELQHKDHLLTMQREEITWLRGEVAKLNDKILMLPATRDRSWWKFWK